jgi:phenylacetate-CoA ligase
MKKLRSLLVHAYNTVPFYHEKLKRVGFRINDLQNLTDLHKIPLTTKSEIQDTPLNKMISRNVNLETCVESKTSGSTGTPLRVISSKKTDGITWRMLTRAYLKNGLRLRDKMVCFRDLSAHPIMHRSYAERLGYMKKEYISIFDDPERQLKFLQEKDPDIIESYPSTLVAIADAFKKASCKKLRLIFSIAEYVDRQSRETIADTFGADLFDYYASTEIGLLSWECKNHADYHINADNIIMEFVDENSGSLAIGETGEIVCTNLNNYQMPLIRYAHGDAGKAIADKCSCGITLPLMKILGGRKDDFLQTIDGKTIPPTIFFPFPFQNFEGIKHFRVIQEKRNSLRVQLVLKELLEPEVFKNAEFEIQKVFGEGMEVKFEILDELSRDRSGKLRKVISKL